MKKPKVIKLVEVEVDIDITTYNKLVKQGLKWIIDDEQALFEYAAVKILKDAMNHEKFLKNVKGAMNHEKV